MSEVSNIKDLHSMVVFLRMREKPSDELIHIWNEGNQGVWTKDEIEAVQKILLERLGKLPERAIKIEDVQIQAENQNQVSYTPFGNPDAPLLSPLKDARVFLFAIFFSCFFIGFLLSGFVTQNAKMYWQFIENTTPADIKQIDVQQIDRDNKRISNPISISDANEVAKFVSIIKEVQDYRPNHPSYKSSILVKLSLADNRKIEFECYTMEAGGKNIFVGGVWITPSFYSYGNGNAQFPEPEFYNWLVSIGVPMQ
jgi:hypothetical protein